MQKDMPGVVDKLCHFLNKTLTQNQKEAIIEHVTFNNMKENETTNYKHLSIIDQSISPFMRKGITGDWKTHLSKEQDEYLDALLKEKLHGTGLQFDYQ